MMQNIDKIGDWKDEGFDWILSEGSPHTQYLKTHNTLHYHHFDPQIPWLHDFAKKTFKMYSITIIKQLPGMVIPNHVDKYLYFKNQHQVADSIKIYRANIFLEDWKSGHYFEADEEPIVKWKAGDYCLLDNTVWHRSGNFGDEPKYTAQITGTKL
tara:strand:+ start:486 stop:950 length:465 start_codon:yes stop_codon:yes gene_type:complete